MLFEAFPPNVRVCKHCETPMQLDALAREGMPVECLKCKAPGVLTVFPCAEPGCDCGGYFGIKWVGIDYGKRNDADGSIIESFFRQAFGKG